MTQTQDLSPILADLELLPGAVDVVELAGTTGEDAARLLSALDGRPLLALIPGAVDDGRLSAFRDALWPAAHLTAIFGRDAAGAVLRRALAGSLALGGRPGQPVQTVLFVRPRTEALGRATTVAKFDANAEGWNGEPGSATYAHFRWMRRLVADVSRPQLGQRVLDAGCGAGWVGIEAALLGAMASAFDPSPAMVAIAKANAASVGVDLDARVGFVEDVPFEQPFDVVLNSGVLSFAPDADVFLDRLDALVRPGGLLVIGDLNPRSRGFSRRRRRRPLLPARELNGLPRTRVESLLGDRGYVVEGHWLYQLTFPVPELMALSEQRLSGFGCGLALVLNKLATAVDHATGSHLPRLFDSWIVRARKAP